eukprot:jgi/Botrbrau1/13974/Bobra.117_2s0004.1
MFMEIVLVCFRNPICGAPSNPIKTPNRHTSSFKFSFHASSWYVTAESVGMLTIRLQIQARIGLRSTHTSINVLQLSWNADGVCGERRYKTMEQENASSNPPEKREKKINPIRR